MKALLKDLLPPLAWRTLRRLRRQDEGISWSGDHPSWAAAEALSTGYGDPAIHQQVEDAVRRVLAGEAAYERDGAVFTEPAVRWPLLAACGLARAADGSLRVLDIGGALGSSWLQHRALLGAVEWVVVEQPAMVERGRRLFPDGNPRFEPAVDAALARGRPGLVLFSAVLPWVADPDGLFAAALAAGAPYVLVDRTLTWDQPRDRITVQQVPPSLYRASYPCRIFAAGRIERLAAAAGYRLLGGMDCPDDHCPLPGVRYRGWLFGRA